MTSATRRDRSCIKRRISSRRFAFVCVAVLLLAPGAGCASRSSAVLEVRGSILYRKPEIVSFSYEAIDDRATGGAFVVRATLQGDPELSASFDITPGVVERAAMTEVAPGSYRGEFRIPAQVTGGPYAVIGRLRHAKAGEVARRDPSPLTIALIP